MKPIYIAAAFAILATLANAAPLQLNPNGCRNYSEDAGQIAVMRDAGIVEQSAQDDYAGKPYHRDVKPHLIELIHFIYGSSLTPDEAQRSLYVECMRNEGWLGRPNT